MRFRLALPLALLAALLANASPAGAVPAVYVTHGAGTGGLSAFTIGAGGALTAIPGSPYALSAFPAQVAFSPTSNNLYAGAGGPYGFSITSGTGALTALPGSPYPPNGESVADIVMAPDGSRIFVPTGLNSKLRVYSVGADGALTQTGPTYTTANTPLGAALTPDGTHLYLANANDDNVTAYNVAADGSLTLLPDSPFPGGTDPFSEAITPDGKYLYVTDNGAGKIRAYDILPSGSLTAVTGSPFAAGTQPFHVVISPDGSHLYAANQGSGNVTAMTIDAATGALTAIPGSPFTAGAGAKGIGMTPDGKHLYTANLTSNNVSAFDVAASGALSAVTGSPYMLPAGGTGVGVTPDRAPTAVFSSLRAPNAKLVDFDALASTDSDGIIARYDWDFGDGTTLPDGGPTPDHTFAADGDYTVKLTLTDDAGCSDDPRYTGQNAYCGIASPASLTKTVTVDSTVKGAAFKAKKKQRLSGGKVFVVAKLKADEPVGVQLSGKIKAGGKTYALKPLTTQPQPGLSTKVKLKLKKKSTAAKVTQALGGNVKAKVHALFTDDLGNTVAEKAKAKLLSAASSGRTP